MVDYGKMLAPVIGMFGVGTVVLAIVAVFVLWWKRRARAALLRLGLPEIDRLTGRDFERLVTAIYEGKGYRTTMTPYVADWGADVVFQGEGKKVVVQAKRYTKRVGVRAVQEVLGAKGKYRADEAVVVTNSTYTDQAVELAKANRVRLRDRTWLNRELERLSAAASPCRQLPEA